MSSDIQYIFIFPDQKRFEFSLSLEFNQGDSTHSQKLKKDSGNIPEWAKLEFNQCSHCPLRPKEHPYCPLALRLVDVQNQFNEIPSYTDVTLEVHAQSRVITQKTTAQKALASLMGLVIAMSGCPYTDFFKPMAQFHVPLGSEQETIFRAMAVYFQSCYFISKKEGKTDFSLDPLLKVYENVQIMNSFIAKRLRHASKEDSAANALILLDLFAKTMPFVIEDSLEELKPVLEPAIQLIEKLKAH